MAKERFYLVRYTYLGVHLHSLFNKYADLSLFIDSLPKDKVSDWSIHELIEQAPFKTSKQASLPSTNIVVTFDSGSYKIINGYSPDNIQKALKDFDFSTISEIKIRMV